MVAKDYSEIGGVAWGDHFDLDTGSAIGDGLENTQLIVDGNASDNSQVFGGFEFGSDNYAFKIALDLLVYHPIKSTLSLNLVLTASLFSVSFLYCSQVPFTA